MSRGQDGGKCLKLLNLKHFWLLFAASMGLGVSMWPKSNPKTVKTAQLVDIKEITPEKRLLAGEKLNLNQATFRELVALPGIGPVLAQKVVEDRAQKGLYSNLERLQRVRGIGAKKIEQIRSLVVVTEESIP